MTDLGRKESNWRQASEHLLGNKLFMEVNVEVNGTLQQEDYSSICQELQRQRW